MSKLLETYSFTNDDIDLITYALCRFSKSTSAGLMAKDARDLIEYIERQKKEKTEPVQP